MRFLYLCPICLILAVVFMVVEHMGKYVVADVIKGVASVFFVVFGLLGSYACRDVAHARMIVIGLVLGAIADVLLNLCYVFEGSKGQLAFISGILVFLAGHVAYLVACLPYCDYPIPCAVVGAVIAAGLLYWIFANVEAKMVFKVFGTFYIGIIAILNVVALAVLFKEHNAHWLVFFGGTLLFLVSDIVLIFNTFGPKKTMVKRVSNLMLYYVGQLMIAASLQLAM